MNFASLDSLSQLLVVVLGEFDANIILLDAGLPSPVITMIVIPVEMQYNKQTAVEVGSAICLLYGY